MRAPNYLLAVTMILLLATRAAVAAAPVVFVCNEENDLYQALKRGGIETVRHETPMRAAEAAAEGSPLLVLADGYPDSRVAVDGAFFKIAEHKKLFLYVEFPAHVPGIELGDPKATTWQRVVVSPPEGLGPRLPRLRILAAHDIRPLAVRGGSVEPLLTVARVAGYDTAVYGIPKDHTPLLFEMHDGRWFIATAKLSGFVTGRYAPIEDWKSLWTELLGRLHVGATPASRVLSVEPTVRPAYSKQETLPPDVERQTLTRAANWYRQSRLLLHPSRKDRIHDLLRRDVETIQMPRADDPAGDGSLGILEGYASLIRPDGTQPQRTPLRADCQAESAMVLAMDDRAESRRIAENLLNYTYTSMYGLGRDDPKHPSFGLISWGAISRAWEVGNYGDDNARTILATLAASASLSSDRWDESLLRALYANLRTTGSLGFRGDRIDQPQLEKLGWRHFHDAKTINYAPHFESGLWACYLWAYARTSDEAFLDKTKTAIRMTMSVYPDDWRWKDNLERSRILLPLAWLVRIEDTPEHRAWLDRVATDLLKHQVECGAIRDHIATTGGGHLQIPQSNEAYGTTETPLIQSNKDPACDQLYTTGFVLLGLREAVAATNDPRLAEAEDKLARFLCRIQVRSEKHPWLDGAWFRAFDFEKWDYWASSGDIGWGVWCAEAGWGPAWTGATLALRQRNTSLWDFTASSKVAAHLGKVGRDMAQNDGSPWKP